MIVGSNSFGHRTSIILSCANEFAPTIKQPVETILTINNGPVN